MRGPVQPGVTRKQHRYTPAPCVRAVHARVNNLTPGGGRVQVRRGPGVPGLWNWGIGNGGKESGSNYFYIFIGWERALPSAAINLSAWTCGKARRPAPRWTSGGTVLCWELPRVQGPGGVDDSADTVPSQALAGALATPVPGDASPPASDSCVQTEHVEAAFPDKQHLHPPGGNRQERGVGTRSL